MARERPSYDEGNHRRKKAIVVINDGGGLYGSLWHYSMLFTLMGSTLLVFIYLWHKGRLDIDEEAKHQMMKEENDER